MKRFPGLEVVLSPQGFSVYLKQFTLSRKKPVGRRGWGLGVGGGRALTVSCSVPRSHHELPAVHGPPPLRCSTKGSGMGPPFPQPPWEKARLPGVGSQGGKVSTCGSLGQWPGLAWPGRLVFLTNGASQPQALPVPSRPPVLSPGPGSLQVRLRDSTLSRTGRRSPGSESTWPERASGASAAGGRQDRPGWGASPPRPAAPPPGHCWGAGSPEGCGQPSWSQQEGREEGVGLRKCIWERRGKRKEKAKGGSHPGSRVKAPVTPRERIFPNAEVK